MSDPKAKTVCDHTSSYLVREMDGSLYCSVCGKKVVDYYDLPRIRTKSWTHINGEHTKVIEVIP